MKVVPIGNSFNNPNAKSQNHDTFSSFKSDGFAKLLADEVSSDMYLKHNEESADVKNANSEIELYLKAQRAHQEIEAKKQQIDRELEASKSQIEGIQKSFDILLKCLKISARIINGDNVPAEDHQLLLENYPEIYSVAMSARQEKEDPENHDSVISKEEKKEEALKVMSQEISKVLDTISSSINLTDVQSS